MERTEFRLRFFYANPKHKQNFNIYLLRYIIENHKMQR